MNPLCFVIMPFGIKNGFDFDEVYKNILRPAIEQAGFKSVRSDDIDQPGVVTKRVADAIFRYEAAVVDITSLNSNVFYELGVRHALRSNVTVLTRRKGTDIPFNIGSMDIQEYDENDPAHAIEKIRAYLVNGMSSGTTDSPIRLFLEELRIQEQLKPFPGNMQRKFPLATTTDKFIGLIAGDIRHVHGVDIWVNGENTDMEMDRCTGRSIGAIIRYMGATHDRYSNVKDDKIANALSGKLKRRRSVPPGAVLETTSGELRKSNDVRLLMHIATVQGTPGKGYKFIDTNVSSYITNLLRRCDQLNRFKWLNEYKTILIPIFGTGNAGERPESVFDQLLNETVRYLSKEKGASMQGVYFLAFSDYHVRMCDRMISSHPATGGLS